MANQPVIDPWALNSDGSLDPFNNVDFSATHLDEIDPDRRGAPTTATLDMGDREHLRAQGLSDSEKTGVGGQQLHCTRQQGPVVSPQQLHCTR